MHGDHRRRRQARIPVLLVLATQVASCSFVAGARKGTGKIGARNYLADAAMAAVAGVGCGLAAIAWGDPDSYAPASDGPTGWANPDDRTYVRSIGATWAPIACTAMAGLTASALYGQYAKDPNDDSAVFGSSFAPAMMGGAAGAAATWSPNQSTQVPASLPAPAVPQVPTCTSDFNCAYGWACVKGAYQSTGTCAQKVDANGMPTYTLPDLGSIGPSDTTNCGFDTDCAIGFRCMKQGADLRGHCMK